MATRNQTMELARNVIAELDREIKTVKGTLEMIERSPDYTGELQDMLILDWTSHLRTLERLREFVIYKA